MKNIKKLVLSLLIVGTGFELFAAAGKLQQAVPQLTSTQQEVLQKMTPAEKIAYAKMTPAQKSAFRSKLEVAEQKKVAAKQQKDTADKKEKDAAEKRQKEAEKKVNEVEKACKILFYNAKTKELEGVMTDLKEVAQNSSTQSGSTKKQKGFLVRDKENKGPGVYLDGICRHPEDEHGKDPSKKGICQGGLYYHYCPSKKSEDKKPMQKK